MCGQEITAARAIETTKINKQKQASAKSTKTGKAEKMFNVDPSMTCKIFCCLCDKVVPLSSIKNHTKSEHKMTLTEYKELCGNPKKQIIKVVYHRCALCQRTVLFDPNEMYKHLKRKHQISYKLYITKYIKQQPGQSIFPESQNTSSLEGVSQQKPSAVIIRCDQCNKTFRQNIQLKIHKKKHCL